jgi:hypothetical protein
VPIDSYRRFGEAQYPPQNMDQLCVLWACKDRAESMSAAQGRLCLILTFNVQWCLTCTNCCNNRQLRFPTQCIYVFHITLTTVIISLFGVPNRSLFQGAVEKLRKAPISFVMSVRLSLRMEKLGSHWTDFHEI